MTVGQIESLIENGKFVGAVISKGGLIAVLVIALLVIGIEAITIGYVLHKFTDRYTGRIATKDWKEHQFQHQDEIQELRNYTGNHIAIETRDIKKDMGSMKNSIDKMQSDLEEMKRLAIKMDINQKLILKKVEMDGGG